MKILRHIYFLGLILISCILVIVSLRTRNQEQDALPEFVIGRWVGEFSETKNGDGLINSYQLEFIEPDQLILVYRTREGEQYNLVYLYEFIGDNRISVKSRMIDEWEINRDGKDLIIHSTYGLVENGHYVRKAVIEWPLVALFLGMITLGLIFIQIKHLEIRDENSLDQRLTLHAKPFTQLLQGIAFAIILCLGIALSRNLWYWHLLRMARIPWDAILIIEIGIAFLIVGVKFIVYNRKRRYISSWLRTMFIYTGVFFLGNGLGSFGFGLLKLAILLYFGYYPTE